MLCGAPVVRARGGPTRFGVIGLQLSVALVPLHDTNDSPMYSGVCSSISAMTERLLDERLRQLQSGWAVDRSDRGRVWADPTPAGGRPVVLMPALRRASARA